MTAMNINSPTYVVSASTASASATLTARDAAQTGMIVYNGASGPALIVTAAVATTAVFPTSASVPTSGTVVPAGGVYPMTKRPGDNIVAIITSTGTGSVFIQVGSGE